MPDQRPPETTLMEEGVRCVFFVLRSSLRSGSVNWFRRSEARTRAISARSVGAREAPRADKAPPVRALRCPDRLAADGEVPEILRDDPSTEGRMSLLDSRPAPRNARA